MATSAKVGASAPSTVKVRLLCSMAGSDGNWSAGEDVSVPIETALRLVDAGSGEVSKEVSAKINRHRAAMAVAEKEAAAAKAVADAEDAAKRAVAASEESAAVAKAAQKELG